MRRIYLSILVVIALLIAGAWMFTKNDNLFSQYKNKNLMPLETISKSTLNEYKNDKFEAEKQRDFIIGKMYTEIFYDELAHEGSHENVPLSILRREPIEKLQVALLDENVDEFLFIFPSESTMEIMSEETDLDKRIELLMDAIQRINRQGQLESISFQLYTDDIENELNEGILYLHYNDSLTVDVPFELEQIGEDTHHLYFKFLTSISKIEQNIEIQTTK